jgi:hypothetical protein
MMSVRKELRADNSPPRRRPRRGGGGGGAAAAGLSASLGDRANRCGGSAGPAASPSSAFFFLPNIRNEYRATDLPL